MSKKEDPRHENLVEWLYQRLLSSERFDVVSKHVNYNLRDANGEVDVMAYVRGDDKEMYYYFYEVKSSDHPRARKRAQAQYTRYRTHHNHKHLEGYIVCPDVIDRLDDI